LVKCSSLHQHQIKSDSREPKQNTSDILTWKSTADDSATLHRPFSLSSSGRDGFVRKLLVRKRHECFTITKAVLQNLPKNREGSKAQSTGRKDTMTSLLLRDHRKTLLN